jgi:4-alpha-glucanotransferase
MPTTPTRRSAGILLHPVSLPGPYGIGDLGPEAYHWVDRLARAKQSWWQILPLGPTGFGDSPYSCFSAFAGNPLLISPERLVEDGLLQPDEIRDVHVPAEGVEYGAAQQLKERWLTQAWERFRSSPHPGLRQEFDAFRAEQASWLDDYSLFMAIKQSRGGAGWQDWPDELRLRASAALVSARLELARALGHHQFTQFLFHRQWQALRRHAAEKGVRLIGDVPIFVASDSADVWANPRMFLLDEAGRPKVVAGVPPDYFNRTGQKWGNPHYDWEAHRRTGYAWWTARIRATLAQVDLVRLDHFLGFVSAYHIPATYPTAEIGEWVPGPGANLFEALRSALGGLPFIAEDLGIVTPDVDALRDRFGLPGMRILQFAFGGATENRFLPHNYERNAVVYTGTHDNDTTWGWYASISEGERDLLRRYLARDCKDVAWDLIRLAWMSVADFALTTLQDVLNLGSEARMNFPGKESGNWSWRFRADLLTDDVIARLADLTELYAREPVADEKK